MSTLKNLIIFFVILLLSLNMAMAQTLTHSNGESTSCGSNSAPAYFEVPKGTISYYEFISNLGKYYKKENDGTYGMQFGHYSVKNNEYYPAPLIAFVLESFYSIELGSMYSGKLGEVAFRIRAAECTDMVLHNEDGTNQFIAQITAHLYFLDYEYVKPEYADYYLKNFGHHFLEALSRRDAKILVIARPNSFSYFAYGDRIQRLNIGFIIETFEVLR